MYLPWRTPKTKSNDIRIQIKDIIFPWGLILFRDKEEHVGESEVDILRSIGDKSRELVVGVASARLFKKQMLRRCYRLVQTAGTAINSISHHTPILGFELTVICVFMRERKTDFCILYPCICHPSPKIREHM